MNVWRIIKHGEKTPFAVRFSFPESDPKDEIKKDAPVHFIPEFSGVAYNWELYDETKAYVRVLSEPKIIGGIRATLYAEVWGLCKGKKIKLQETWYATGTPKKGVELLEKVILGFEEAMQKQLDEIAESKEQKKPAPFYKTERDESIDPFKNAREATLRLLEKDNPELAKAIKDGKANEACAKAFVADTVRRTGSGPSGFSTDDPQFLAMVADAWQAYDRRTKRKSKVDSIDYHLADPRNWCRYYNLKPERIAPLVSAATSTTQLSAGAIAKRIRELGLVQPWKRGKPPKK